MLQALVKNETEVRGRQRPALLQQQHKTHCWLTSCCFCSQRALLQEVLQQGGAVGPELKQLKEMLQLHHTFKVKHRPGRTRTSLCSPRGSTYGGPPPCTSQ